MKIHLHTLYCLFKNYFWSLQFEKGFPGGAVVKNLPTNAKDMGLFPKAERSPGGGNTWATCSSILAWKIPWTEEPGRQKLTGSQNWTWLSNLHFFQVNDMVWHSFVHMDLLFLIHLNLRNLEILEDQETYSWEENSL